MRWPARVVPVTAASKRSSSDGGQQEVWARVPFLVLKEHEGVQVQGPKISKWLIPGEIEAEDFGNLPRHAVRGERNVRGGSEIFAR